MSTGEGEGLDKCVLIGNSKNIFDGTGGACLERGWMDDQIEEFGIDDVENRENSNVSEQEKPDEKLNGNINTKISVFQCVNTDVFAHSYITNILCKEKFV